MIVIMAGLPASGKSTLCRELAALLSGAVLDKDAIRAALFSERDIEYSTEQDDFCMKVVLDAAEHILRKDPSRVVFLDGRPFSRISQIDAVIKAARAIDQGWRIIECVCPEETARKRLADPGTQDRHPAANRDFPLYLRVKAQFEAIKFPKTVIDTDLPLHVCVQCAMEALR
ncbi:MAG: AAA family ATPase [Terriglobales bacterium]